MQDHRNIVVVLVVALVAAAIAIVTLLSLRDNIDEARGTRDIGRQGVDTGAPEEAATARAAGFALDEPPEPTATAEPAPTPTPAFPATVLDVLVANVRWAESSEHVDETSLGQVLAGDGPFTLFAPRNGAFAEIGTALDDGILGNDYAEERFSATTSCWAVFRSPISARLSGGKKHPSWSRCRARASDWR